MKTIILIPPSEGKSFGGEFKPLENLNPITLGLLEKINSSEPEKLYGLNNNALEQAIDVNKNILNSKTLPAINRYSGVVYSAINYSTLKNKELFNDRVRIVSALFGLIAPLDLIPNYRLKIAKLRSASLWLDYNSKLLKDSFVIDLLPKAHRKSVSYAEGVEVDFVFIKQGKKLPAGHQGKHIKGRFVRWLIENDISNPVDFVNFKEDGYFWNGTFFLKEIK